MIRFRSHHFMCTLGFQGKGYSPAFISNFKDIVSRLERINGESTEIEVVAVCDDICGPCPQRRSMKCQHEEKIQNFDNHHSEILGIQVGQKITWGEAKTRIKKKMTLSNFHVACESCKWKSLGYCEQALQDILQD